MLSQTMTQATAESTARHERAIARGRREARFDIRRGSAITASDAREEKRFTSDPVKQSYWTGYADEMVKQGHR